MVGLYRGGGGLEVGFYGTLATPSTNRSETQLRPNKFI